MSLRIRSWNSSSHKQLTTYRDPPKRGRTPESAKNKSMHPASPYHKKPYVPKHPECFMLKHSRTWRCLALQSLILQADHVKPNNFFLKIIYLFILDREKRRHRQREKQAPRQEPDAGLDPGTPGSRPGPKAGAEPLGHPGFPLNLTISFPCPSIPRSYPDCQG